MEFHSGKCNIPEGNFRDSMPITWNVTFFKLRCPLKKANLWFKAKYGTCHVLNTEFGNKRTVKYPPKCSIFQNGISFFRYNLTLKPT